MALSLASAQWLRKVLAWRFARAYFSSGEPGSRCSTDANGSCGSNSSGSSGSSDSSSLSMPPTPAAWASCATATGPAAAGLLGGGGGGGGREDCDSAGMAATAARVSFGGGVGDRASEPGREPPPRRPGALRSTMPGIDSAAACPVCFGLRDRGGSSEPPGGAGGDDGVPVRPPTGVRGRLPGVPVRPM